jgi:hypothetical protein
VEARLQEPDADRLTLGGSIDRCLHQLPSNAGILNRWIDRYRPDPPDDRALIHEIASGNAAVHLGNPEKTRGWPSTIAIVLAAACGEGKSGGKP